MKLFDALDTMRIFCKALGHTPEINVENWEHPGLLNVAFMYQDLYLSLWMHKSDKTPTIHATLFDLSVEPSRVIVDIAARPEFVLDVVKQAADRYPVKQVA